MNTALRKAEGRFSETAIDGETVIMHLDSGVFFSLTGAAREIWLLIDGQRNEAEIVAALAGIFGGNERAIADDVATFIAQLTEADLVLAA